MILEFIIFLVGFLLGSIIIWFVRQKEFDSFKQNQEELKKNFSDLSNEALLNNQKSFLELAENKFSSLLDNSEDQLDKKKELIDSSLKEMKERLKSLSENTVALKSQMEESRITVGDLSDTTLRLRQILSSNQARGQWGERMVEYILNFIGLTEGINFKQQTQQDSSRPDFTFFLPDEKVINMDVKFPLNHYENYVNAESESEKELEKKAFIKDVRNRIKEVSDRSYIDPKGGTVDYVLLFIPNESIYSFLNREDDTLIDFSLERKIILCSPITLYAILSLVRQAVSNFAMEQKAGEMQELVGVFRKQWEQFKTKINAMNKSIGALTNHYEELRGPRLRELEKPMDKINELQLGSNDKVLKTDEN